MTSRTHAGCGAGSGAAFPAAPRFAAGPATRVVVLTRFFWGANAACSEASVAAASAVVRNGALQLGQGRLAGRRRGGGRVGRGVSARHGGVGRERHWFERCARAEQKKKIERV